MKSKFYNFDPVTGFTSDFSLGGLPIFTDDIQQLENASKLFGAYAMLKGWSCVLSGCQVDEIDTISKTCSVKPGFILLNDIVYYFTGIQNQPYPFAITKGTETIDARLFNSNDEKDVAIEYDYNIQASGFVLENDFPTNLPNRTGIYFDPFTGQKADHILRNRYKSKMELTTFGGKIVYDATETNKAISGSSVLSPIITNSTNLKWDYMGYYFVTKSGNYIKQSDISEDFSIDVNKGSNQITLVKENLPKHQHELSGDSATSKADLGGDHDHIFATDQYYGPADRESLEIGYDSNYPSETPHAFRKVSKYLTSRHEGHEHTLSGNTGKGEVSNLSDTPTSLDLSNLTHIEIAYIQWGGYNQNTPFWTQGSYYTPNF